MWLLRFALAVFLIFSGVSWGANTHGTGNTQQEMQAWFGDTLPPYAVSGCLPSTSGTTTLGAFACKTYVEGASGDLVYVDQPSKAVGPLSGGDGTYWLAAHRDAGSTVGSWTRQTGTHYLWIKSSARPTTPAGAIIFASATVASSAVSAISDWRVPRSYAIHGVFDITDPLFGGAGDAVLGSSGTDNVAAWNIARHTAATRRGVIYFPHGNYRFNSKPGGIYGGVKIQCEDVVTYLVRNYNEGTPAVGFIDMNVANTSNLTNGGGGVESCGIYAESGTTGGSAVNLESSATASQGFIYLRKLYITGAGTFSYGIRGDGSAKSSAPEGLRDVLVTETNVFQTTVAGILILGFNNVSIATTAIFIVSGDGLILDGGTGGTVTSNYATVEVTFCATAKIGATSATNQVTFITPNTTTLTTASTMSNLTIVGNVATLVGTASVGSAGVGLHTPGKIVSGVSGPPTTGGGKLETSNGITFPATQVAMAQRNTLDDFETDTYTPTAYGSSGAGTTTYTAQYGYYTKIGRVVCIGVTVSWTNMTSTGNLRVLLPFGPENDGNYVGMLTVVANNLTVGAGKQLVAYTTAGGAAEAIIAAMDIDGGGAIAQVAVDTSATIYLSGCYFADQ